MFVEIMNGDKKIVGFEALKAEDALVIVKSVIDSHDTTSIIVNSLITGCEELTFDTNCNWESEIVKVFDLAINEQKLFWVALDASGRINEVTEFQPVDIVNSNNFKWSPAIITH